MFIVNELFFIFVINDICIDLLCLFCRLASPSTEFDHCRNSWVCVLHYIVVYTTLPSPHSVIIQRLDV